MANIRYNDSLIVTTPNLSLTIGTDGSLSFTGSYIVSSLTQKVDTYASPTTLTTNNSVVLVSSAGITMTLPSAPPNGFSLIIRNILPISGTNSFTLTRGGTDVIRRKLSATNQTSFSVTSDTSNGPSLFMVYSNVTGTGTWWCF
jgi:hypothetical protein